MAEVDSCIIEAVEKIQLLKTNKGGSPVQDPADFETAISLTGYGKFNYMLMLVALPATWTSAFDTSTMSYVLPSAECDLQLTSFHKGVLNAITYAGMIASAFVWGFMSDNLGRQKLLVIGYFLDSACGFVSSFSQSFSVLVTLRFFSGFIISGPHAVLLSYLAEFHGARYRARVIMMTGVYNALASISLPGFAWALIPMPWSWKLFGGYITYNSWRLFIAVCCLPSFLSAICMLFYDESPKFLLSQGKNKEALIILQKVYAMNTGNPPSSYPVKELAIEKTREIASSFVVKPATRSSSTRLFLKLGWKQIKPLFKVPLASKAALIFTIQFGCLLSMNTIRLWMPQLFFIMEDFSKMQETLIDSNISGASVCDIVIHTKTAALANASGTIGDGEMACSVNVVKSQMYINAMIVGGVSGGCYLLAGSLINAVGRRKLLITNFFVAGGCGIGIYYSRNVHVTLFIISLFLALTSICGKAIISIVVDIFPTTVRAMAVSLTLMCGRIGALLGNLMFPILLDLNCSVPFFLVSGIVMGCGGLSFILPFIFVKLID